MVREPGGQVAEAGPGGTQASGRAPAAFDEADDELAVGLEVIGEAANYIEWIAAMCDPYLGGRVLEIGAGHGDLSQRFAVGRELMATDASERCVRVLEERFAGSPSVSVRRLEAGAEPLEGAVVPFDSAVMVNVLEHIEDDAAVLAWVHSVLRPGGAVVLYVPALEALYSRFDRMIGHWRRYSKASLAAVVESAGFEVVDLRYANSLGAVAWFVFCRLLGQRTSRTWVVQAWDRLAVPVLRRAERVVRPPFGSSLFCAAVRRRQ